MIKSFKLFHVTKTVGIWIRKVDSLRIILLLICSDCVQFWATLINLELLKITNIHFYFFNKLFLFSLYCILVKPFTSILTFFFFFPRLLGNSISLLSYGLGGSAIPVSCIWIIIALTGSLLLSSLINRNDVSVAALSKILNINFEHKTIW